MMRAMRENTKWVFYILVVAFVGWLVVDVGMGLTGAGQYSTGDAVLKVNGESVRLPEYQNAYQNAVEQIRARTSQVPLTREDEQQLQDQVVEQLIQSVLLRQTYKRLGLQATPREIQEEARTNPPQELMQLAQFQTDGRFDPAKWQRFLAAGATGGADPQFLLSLEARYREEIPQIKLAQYLTSDVYVSDAKLWRLYRDQHDSVAGTFVAMLPSMILDVEVSVSDDEMRAHLRSHESDFKRPAAAFVSYVAVPRLPDPQDSAAARSRAARLRAEAARSQAAFETVAKRESADSVSGREGGDLGWIQKTGANFDRDFVAALQRLRAGEVSQPVATQFGLHIIRVDQARGDSVRARHILIPFDLRPEHLDVVEGRADSLDRIAADQPNGTMLDTAARLLGVPVSPRQRVVQGDRLQLGRWLVPDVGVWAFEARVGETSPVVEAEPAYYVFRLDSLIPEGIPPFDDLRAELAAAVRLEKKQSLLNERAQRAYETMSAEPDLAAAAQARGLRAEAWGPFTRLSPPGYLSREPLVLGTAFGLGVGQRSHLIKGRDGYYVVQVRARQTADSAAWLAQKDMQREQTLQAARQARLRTYIDGLRASATVVDRRKELFRPPAATDDAGT
jgi:peptidyl-prolyl cis-trans isomerase D